MPNSQRQTGFFQQKLTRYLIRHMLTGIAVGWTLLLLLIWSNLGGIGSLVRGSDAGALALTMLAGAFGITFGSAAMGIAANRLDRVAPDPEEPTSRKQ